MARSFKLPDLGEGIHEGEVLAVLVSVGDEVKEGDPICEVETDKAAVEIPSPFTGVVQEIKVKPGDVVKVGDVIMTFSDGAEAEPVAEKTVEKSEEKPPEPTEKEAPAPALEKRTGPVPASPATRRLARELGVDLKDVPPTGPAGLVTSEDVQKFAKESKVVEEVREVAEVGAAAIPETAAVTLDIPSLPDFSKWGPVERVPFRSIRKATAKQMSLAWSQIPHVNSQDSVDVTKLEDFR